MSDPLVSLTDFATYLNNDAIDETRAAFILELAQEKCETIVSPLPAAARSVILDVAERAYANPTTSGGSNPAYYAEGEGPFSSSTPGFSGGGLFLTKTNKADLRRAAGGGTAFTIDMLPADLPALPSWDVGSYDPTLADLP